MKHSHIVNMEIYVGVVIFSCMMALGYSNTTHVATNDPVYCAKVTATNNLCTAFQMVPNTGTCQLKFLVKGVVFDANQCSYYVQNVSTVTVVNRNLNGIQQIIQNAVYNKQRTCPDYWDEVNGAKCTFFTTKETCSQYDSFLETYWNGSICIAPKMTRTITCPDNTYTVVNTNLFTYCYKLISKSSININDKNIVDTANEYCIEQTGGQIASIYDKNENNAVNAIQLKSTEPNGIMIGLKADLESEKLYWSDGASNTYENFNTEPNVSASYTMTMMMSTGQWTADPAQFSDFSFIACKVKANVVLTKT